MSRAGERIEARDFLRSIDSLESDSVEEERDSKGLDDRLGSSEG